MKDHTLQLDEGQRQMVLLALAKLSIERPGWLEAIEEIAMKMDNRTAEGKPEMLYEFRRICEGTLRSEAKKNAAAFTVQSLYAGFDVDTLERILEIGLAYESESDEELVMCMNEALASEIERRKASR